MIFVLVYFAFILFCLIISQINVEMFGKDLRRKGDEIPLYSMKVVHFRLFLITFKILKIEATYNIFAFILF